MYVKLSWRPEVDDNWAIMVVQPTILTYTTMVFYFWLGPQVLWNDLRGIVIKQRHWQTFWGIIHVCQAILETGSGRQLSHNGCTAGNFDLPDHGFLLLTWSTGPMEWSTGNSYQAEALTNVLRYHTCRSSLREDWKLSITELNGMPGPWRIFRVITHIGFSHFSG
jgi:hypothetical protein